MKMEEFVNADSLIQVKIVANAKMDILKTLKLENATLQEHAHNWVETLIVMVTENANK